MSVRFAIAKRRPIPNVRGARGFSLIELIAAFLVFALGVGILMQTLASSMRSTRLSADYTQAALWAESMMDTVGVGEPVREGSATGEFDRDYRWQLEVHKIDPQMVDVRQPLAAGNTTNGKNGQNAQLQQGGQQVGAQLGANGQAEVPIDLFQVDLTVRWGNRFREREAHFATLLSANPETPGLGAPPGMQSGRTTMGRGGRKPVGGSP